ncbi:hypothetical protein CBI38_21245 [Rhodococcus oxybenzonivorans]|uniref:Uncharacterized protein n=1 Tax=Rhodococcus oxybenzonivorans TaxID=1990687 RepID=A0A2S2BYK5_9NOCA|nr:hypothetical protein CBI38_21245 [Rhodococcus oxybenzonivorans]
MPPTLVQEVPVPEYRATACRSGVQAVNGVAGDPERVAGPTDGFPIYNPVMGGDSGRAPKRSRWCRVDRSRRVPVIGGVDAAAGR